MAEDFGVKVSLPGYNAETAADQDLYFNSSWPFLKMDTNLSGTTTLTQSSTTVITHNLGYPPLVFVFSKANGFYPYYIQSINSQTITFIKLPIYDPATDEIQYYICRNPLNINYQAPNINLAATEQGTNHQDWGVKFSKPGKDVSSTDLRDFTIHSGTKSLQVHQVIYQPLTSVSVAGGTTYSPALQYITELPYSPVYFAFYTSDQQNFIPLFTTSQTNPKINYAPITGGIIINDVGGSGGLGCILYFVGPISIN